MFFNTKILIIKTIKRFLLLNNNLTQRLYIYFLNKRLYLKVVSNLLILADESLRTIAFFIFYLVSQFKVYLITIYCQEIFLNTM